MAVVSPIQFCVCVCVKEWSASSQVTNMPPVQTIKFYRKRKDKKTFKTKDSFYCG